MSHYPDHIIVDCPNIPILNTEDAKTIPFGQFVEVKPGSDESNDSALGSARVHDMYLPNFSLRSFEGRFPADVVFQNQSGTGTELPGSCLFLKGNIRSVLPGGLITPESYNHSQNFKFDPHNEFRHILPAETDAKFIHFSYTVDFFNQFLPENESWADILKTRMAKKERILGDHFSAISLTQEQALNNIFNSPLTGKLRYMMIETSIIQIVLLQMYSLFHRQEAYKPAVPNKRDIETIQDLKDYLNRTFLDDHCMTSLSRQFGVNTNKLMALFRKLFGKSIFEFIAERRMDHAKQLLRDRGLLVTEVARTVGYKNPNHFSSAFKKRYGINPSAFR